jgi:predicted secreted hydrolase
MEMKGTVTLADGAHEIEGVAWFEHQWGNLRGASLRYFWGYARFENGDTITWRQYYDDVSGGKPTKGDTEHKL